MKTRSNSYKALSEASSSNMEPPPIQSVGTRSKNIQRTSITRAVERSDIKPSAQLQKAAMRSHQPKAMQQDGQRDRASVKSDTSEYPPLNVDTVTTRLMEGSRDIHTALSSAEDVPSGLPDTEFDLLFANADAAHPFAYRRVKMDIVDDDVEYLRARQPEFVRMFMRGIQSTEMHPPQQNKVNKKNTSKEDERWAEWQQEGQDELDNMLGLPNIREDLEARAWVIIQELIDTHKKGCRLQSYKVDTTSKCMKRVDDALRLIKQFAHVRKDAMDHMNIAAFVASPAEYTERKVKNMWGNYRRAQWALEAKKKLEESKLPESDADFTVEHRDSDESNGVGQLNAPFAKSKSSCSKKRTRTQSVGDEQGEEEEAEVARPKKKAKSRKKGAGARRKRIPANESKASESSTTPNAKNDQMQELRANISEEAFVDGMSANGVFGGQKEFLPKKSRADRSLQPPFQLSTGGVGVLYTNSSPTTTQPIEPAFDAGYAPVSSEWYSGGEQAGGHSYNLQGVQSATFAANAEEFHSYHGAYTVNPSNTGMPMYTGTEAYGNIDPFLLNAQSAARQGQQVTISQPHAPNVSVWDQNFEDLLNIPEEDGLHLSQNH